MMSQITGVVFYDGPSKIDGKPIIGIATFGTANAKTGNLVQTWIMRKDVHPIMAINTGEDASICGACPLRGLIRPVSERIHKGKYEGKTDTVNKGRSCYVLVQQAPLGVYSAFHRGNYPVLSMEHKRFFLGRGVRYGSYGDPVAIPMKDWDALVKLCTGSAEPGYTHQWKDRRFKAWSKRVMASTHTVAENRLASSKGWRTFRTIISEDQRAENEIICPASAEGGYKATCETCGACNGRRDMSDGRKSVAIVAHGGAGKLGLVQRVIESAV